MCSDRGRMCQRVNMQTCLGRSALVVRGKAFRNGWAALVGGDKCGRGGGAVSRCVASYKGETGHTEEVAPKRAGVLGVPPPPSHPWCPHPCSPRIVWASCSLFILVVTTAAACQAGGAGEERLAKS